MVSAIQKIFDKSTLWSHQTPFVSENIVQKQVLFIQLL